MLPKALKVEVKSRSKEKRPKMRCFSLCGPVDANIETLRGGGIESGQEEVVDGAGGVGIAGVAPTLHLGNSERNFKAMGLGLAILLPAKGWRVPARGPVATSGWVGS